MVDRAAGRWNDSLPDGLIISNRAVDSPLLFFLFSRELATLLVRKRIVGGRNADAVAGDAITPPSNSGDKPLFR